MCARADPSASATSPSVPTQSLPDSEVSAYAQEPLPGCPGWSWGMDAMVFVFNSEGEGPYGGWEDLSPKLQLLLLPGACLWGSVGLCSAYSQGSLGFPLTSYVPSCVPPSSM